MSEHLEFRDEYPHAPAHAQDSAKHKRQLECQRKRREQRRRIDYYPSADALEVILSRTFGSVGGDQSSIINKLILATARKRTAK